MPRSVEVFISEILTKPDISEEDGLYWEKERQSIANVRPDGSSPVVHFGVISQGRLYAGFDRTRQYFRRAIELGLDQIYLNTTVHPLRKKAFVSGLKVSKKYLETDATLAEIGDDMGVGRERVRQIVGSTLSKITSVAPEDLKAVFLPDDLETGKHLTLRSKIKVSESKEGKTSKAIVLLREGRSPQEIKEQLDIKHLSDVRTRLKEWGTEEQMGYIRTSYEVNPRITAVISNPQSIDREVQEALDQVKIGFYDVDQRRKGMRLLTPVSDLARECGFHFRADKAIHFITALKAEGLPMREIILEVHSDKYKGQIHRYHLIASIHRDRAIKILSEAENLQSFRQNPVQILFHPEEREIPSTTQLIQRRGFKSLAEAFRQADIKIASGKFISFLGADCPVTIFRMKKSLFFCDQDLDRLVSYLRSKIVV